MTSQPQSDESKSFDVRTIPCQIKHAQIFQRWVTLPVSDHFVLVNDHDPVPLYHQFAGMFAGAFAWDYLERGPDIFRVKITRLAPSLSSPAASPSRGTSQADLDESKILDVRPIPGRLKHTRIFERWRGLPVGEYFLLLNDHDPVPLRYQFAAEFPGAFAWEYLMSGPDEFVVKITRLTNPGESGESAEGSGAEGKDVVEVDARGLEPPEPLMRILGALESLSLNQRLRAITDREPCHLFGEAENRGFNHETSQQADGSWVTLLFRR